MRSSWAMLAAGAIAMAAASVWPCTAGAAVSVRLETLNAAVSSGDTVEIDVVVPAADSAFNAFHLVVRYDPTLVTFVPTSPVSVQVGPVVSDACSNLFHQFNNYGDSNVDSTVTDLSMLCAQTFVAGPGAIYRLRFQAGPVPGAAAFSIGVTSRFYHGGPVVTSVNLQGLTVVIGNVNGVPPADAGRGARLEAPHPNPLHTGQGASVAFTLPSRARVVLELFDLLGRKIDERDAGDVPAGSSSVRWALPTMPAGSYQLRLRADGRTVGRTTWVILR